MKLGRIDNETTANVGITRGVFQPILYAICGIGSRSQKPKDQN